MVRVFVTNEVTINTESKKIVGSNKYAYYHPKCWSIVLKRIKRKPHLLKENISIAQIDTDDPVVLNKACKYCNHRIGEAC